MNLFLELRRHGKLAAKRHPMYEKNKFGKFWMYFMAVFWAGYLIFFGTTFAFALDEESREPYQIINGVLIIILALDFLMRFPFQKTPTQEIKPYLLLPVRRSRLIDFLLLRSGLAGFNFIWLFFFVPLAVINVSRYYGAAGVLTYCAGIWLLMVLNNYWFLLCRTLMNERIWWVFLPIVFYAGIGCALFIPDESPLFDWSVTFGEGFVTGNPLYFLGLIVAIALLWLVNRKVMQGLVYSELNKVEDTTVKVRNVSEYRFLDRYGEIGEYMRLELKLLLRNKICKASLRSIIIVVLAFSGLLGFTDIYDSTGMKNFIMVYNYVIFGTLFISNIMGYEGNYIDGLMSRKESIYALLRAKYILYSLAILLPFLLMIPAMVMGKLTVLSCLAWDAEPPPHCPDGRNGYKHRADSHRSGLHPHFPLLAEEHLPPLHATQVQKHGRIPRQPATLRLSFNISIHHQPFTTNPYPLMIEITQLQKNFGTKKAVDIENYTIAPGEMLGLVGNNGAGKTTLFRLILDLLQADRGTVSINGTDVSKSEDWKNFTGAFIDDGFLIDYLTPEEYFYFIGKMYGLKKEEVDERLKPFERFMNGEVLGQKKFIRNYSMGNKQKIGIISAMLHHPQLLILDEPFNFLDPSSQAIIKHLLKRYNEEHAATVIISSHNLNHTVDICPRIALLEHGVIIRDLQNENNSAEQELEAYFNIRVEEEISEEQHDDDRSETAEENEPATPKP